MSGTAKTNADVRCELSASSIRAILARKLAQVQTRVRPRQSADSDLLNWLVDSERQPLNLMMHITDEEAAELKIWIVKKLENISDADSDVLADYVLALIRVDTEEAELKINAVDSLEDFLKDDTAAFVGDVFHAVRTRSYKPGYVPPLVVPSYNLPPAAPSGPSGAYGSLGAGRGSNGGFQESRKRSYNDHQENGSRGDSHYARGDRQMKQLRRGGRGGRGDGFGNRGGRGGFQDPGYPFPHAASPPLPPTFPNMPMPSGLPFDPNDPMAAIIAMQAMGLPPLPGMPALPGAASPTNGHQFGGQDSPEFAGPRRRERCRDYDTQGYCARGDSCPYEHGTDRLIAPNQDEYDPKNALLSAQPKSTVTSGHNSFNESRGNGPARGSGRGRGDRGGFPPRKANRAEFSQAGPNYDPSITTIVVEQIPEEKFDEQSVRGFFSEFGNITEVTMQPYKRLSLVKYDDYTGARRAYDSPKVIFDNRFVKVYWYNPNTLPTPPAAGKTSSESLRPKEEEQPFDKEEFERNAMAAQKKLEEKKSQMREMEIKRQALEKQKEELAQKQTEEKRKLLEKLAAKGITSDTTMTDSTTNGTNGANDGKVSAHTKALREKVAELEAEAKSLGLDSALSDYSPRGRGRGRGRGSYRGWEGFAGRGGAFDSPRGRGGFRGRGGGKYNLDNRTKKVAISGVKFDSEKDEALRSYLLGVGEYNAIEPHSKGTDTQIITFKDRPTAESFMYGTKEIPNVGKLEFSWHNAPNAPSQAPTKQAGVDADVGMGGTNADNGEANRTMPMEDYDIAEDYDVADDIS